MTDPAILFFAGLTGLAVGSFLNVCVARWPHRKSVVRRRSACPACAAAIRWYDLIPILSWLVLRARCRACVARISVCYPLVEGAAAAICAGMVLTRGVTLEAAGGSLFLLILLGIALTDARFYLIPDQFSVGGAAAGLALSVAPGGVTPESAALGAAVGFGGMWLVGAGGTWMLVRVNPGRLEAAGREHHDGRRRVRDTRVVRALAGPAGRLAACLPVAGAVVGWWGFGPAGALAAGAAAAAAAAVLVAWAEGLGGDSATSPATAHTPDDALAPATTHTPDDALAPAVADPLEDSATPAVAATPDDAHARAEADTATADAPAATSTLADAATPDDAHASPGAVMGGGDVKMMALTGAFTGPWGAVLTVFVATLCGILAYLALRLLAGSRQLIPFGVFLAVGAAVTLLYGDALLSWYLLLIGLPSPLVR